MIDVLAFDNVKKQVTMSLEEFKRIQADLKELQAISDKWTDVQTQYAIECDRIEHKLLKNSFEIEYIIHAEEVTLTVWFNSDNDMEFDGKTKLEALQKSEKWFDGRSLGWVSE